PESVFVGSLGQHDRKFLAADARHPVHAAPQVLLQPLAELAQDLVPGRVPETVVQLLEHVYVAEDQRQGAPVTRGALHLAREVLAEEAAARDPGEIVGRGQAAVFGERDAQDRLELGDPPRGANPRVELALTGVTRHALVRPGREPGLAQRALIA